MDGVNCFLSARDVGRVLMRGGHVRPAQQEEVDTPLAAEHQKREYHDAYDDQQSDDAARDRQGLAEVRETAAAAVDAALAVLADTVVALLGLLAVALIRAVLVALAGRRDIRRDGVLKRSGEERRARAHEIEKRN